MTRIARKMGERCAGSKAYPVVAATSPEGPVEGIEALVGNQTAVKLLDDSQIVEEEMILGGGITEARRGEDSLRGALAKRNVRSEPRVGKKPVEEGCRHGGRRDNDTGEGVSDGADTRLTGAEEDGEGRDGAEAELRGRLPRVVRVRRNDLLARAGRGQ